jgi:hypothetical protein
MLVETMQEMVKDMWYIDGRVVGSGMGLFLIWDHWPKILPQNQLNVCTVYVCCVWCTPFPQWLKFVPGWPGNFCQSLTTVKSGTYDMVWLNV